MAFMKILRSRSLGHPSEMNHGLTMVINHGTWLTMVYHGYKETTVIDHIILWSITVVSIIMVHHG